MYQLELVFRLLVRLQFMYFQYNVYLSIVVRTNIIYKYIKKRSDNIERLSVSGVTKILQILMSEWDSDGGLTLVCHTLWRNLV